MPYDYKLTVRVIRRLRLERGLSQEVFSGLAGMSRSHLSEIENHKINPNVETLWKIAYALEMRLSDFLRIVEDEHERALD